MRFKAVGLWILDRKREFEFPMFESKSDAIKVADILNQLVGDSK